MVKEFEMKKSVDQYARAATAKTGTLDMGALHTYKFNDDLFKKVTTLLRRNKPRYGYGSGLVWFNGRKPDWYSLAVVQSSLVLPPDTDSVQGFCFL